jgi:hypothetical protein
MRRVMSPLRRFFQSVLVTALGAGIGPALAADVTIHASFRMADDIVVTARDPRVTLDRGGTVDGLPVLHGRNAVVIDWSAIRHLVFIPGDPPMALVSHRDGSEMTFEIERCSIMAGGTSVDIHDIAEIDIR